MKTYDTLSKTEKDQADTIIMNTARGWMSTEELRQRCELPTCNHVVNLIKLLKAEGYKFLVQRKTVKTPYGYGERGFWRLEEEPET